MNILNGEILHISFQAPKADQKVNSVIHIILKNTEKITDLLEKMLLEIPYASLLEDMIDTVKIITIHFSQGEKRFLLQYPKCGKATGVR